MRTTVLSLTLALAALPCSAQDWTGLGFGDLITNDRFGDGKDRWQTGSVQSSYAWVPGHPGDAPAFGGRAVEFRLGAGAIAPSDVTATSDLDRPYAGYVSVGLHSHFLHHGLEVSAGADLLMIGPDTGISDLQSAVHDISGDPPLSDFVLDSQIGNKASLGLVGEVGAPLRIGGNARLRPFAEFRLGAEDMIRLGFDATIGGYGEGALMVRDPVSGHRYRVGPLNRPGFSAVFGADLAYVSSSLFLPRAEGYELDAHRARVRAGGQYQAKNVGVFYGLTWLSPEFEGQDEGQTIGSVSVDFRF